MLSLSFHVLQGIRLVITDLTLCIYTYVFIHAHVPLFLIFTISITMAIEMISSTPNTATPPPTAPPITAV